MKAIKSIAWMPALAAFLIIGCLQTSSYGGTKPTGRAEHVSLQVTGMMCSECSKSLESSLCKFKGAKNVTADYNTGQASLDLPALSQVTKVQLQKAVADAGFTLMNVKFTEAPLKSANLKVQDQ